MVSRPCFGDSRRNVQNTAVAKKFKLGRIEGRTECVVAGARVIHNMFFLFGQREGCFLIISPSVWFGSFFFLLSFGQGRRFEVCVPAKAGRQTGWGRGG